MNTLASKRTLTLIELLAFFVGPALLQQRQQRPHGRSPRARTGKKLPSLKTPRPRTPNWRTQILIGTLFAGLCGLVFFTPVQRLIDRLKEAPVAPVSTNEVRQPETKATPDNPNRAEKLVGSRWEYKCEELQVDMKFNDFDTAHAVVTATRANPRFGAPKTESWHLEGLVFVEPNKMSGTAVCAEHGGAVASVVKITRLASNELLVELEFDDGVKRLPIYPLRRVPS